MKGTFTPGPSQAIIRARRKPLPPVPRPKIQIVEVARGRPRKQRAQNFSQRGPRSRGPRARGKSLGAGNFSDFSFDAMRAGAAMSQIMVGKRSLDRPTPFAGVEVVSTAIAGSATTAFTSFSANPAQAASFPLLSKEAQIFEKYRYTKLRYHYMTKVNQFVANGVGTVVMSYDYDAADAPPSSLQAALNSRPNAMGAPYMDFSTGDIAPGAAKKTDWYYLRPGVLPGASAIQDYDMGNINITVDSTVNTNPIGMLFVEYEGWFSTKVQEGSTTAPVNNRVSWFQSSATELLVTSVQKTLLLAKATPPNGIGIVNTAGSMVPPAGNYNVDVLFTAIDNTAELFNAFFDFQKNAVTVYGSGVLPQQIVPPAVGGETSNVGAPAFVTANGTDAFTLKVTAVGAAGTLNAVGSVRWTSV